MMAGSTFAGSPFERSDVLEQPQRESHRAAVRQYALLFIDVIPFSRCVPVRT